MAIAGNVRIGGFGGADGLAAYLRERRVALVIDATHPFADRISAHARLACASLSLGSAAMLAMVERLAYFTSARDLGFDDAAVVDTLTTMLHRGVFGAPTRRRAATSKRS